MKKSDKGKWFTTEDYGTMFQCKTDSLIDFLTDIFKGNKIKAKRACLQLREVTLQEYNKFKLFENY